MGLVVEGAYSYATPCTWHNIYIYKVRKTRIINPLENRTLQVTIRWLSVCRTSVGWGSAVCNNLVARPTHFKGLFPVTISIVGLEPGPRPWRAENVVGNQIVTSQVRGGESAVYNGTQCWPGEVVTAVTHIPLFSCLHNNRTAFVIFQGVIFFHSNYALGKIGKHEPITLLLLWMREYNIWKIQIPMAMELFKVFIKHPYLTRGNDQVMKRYTNSKYLIHHLL